MREYLLGGIDAYQRRIVEAGGKPTTSSALRRALISGGFNQAFQTYWSICLERGSRQRKVIQNCFDINSEGSKLDNIFAGLFAMAGPLEALVTLAGGSQMLRSLYASTPIVDWVGEKSKPGDSEESVWPEGTTAEDQQMAKRIFEEVVGKGGSPQEVAAEIAKLVERVAKERREEGKK